MKSFDSFHDAFHSLVDDVVVNGRRVACPSSPSSVGSNFGNADRVSFEVLCSSFELRNPLHRFLPQDCRAVSQPFAFANFLWALTPDASTEQILAYNARGAAFCDDLGVLLCGISARLAGVGQSSPIRDALALLRRDPATRRAYVPFVYANDLKTEPRDFSCFGSMHFMLRANRLDCLTNMRSQSLVGVLPYDIILLTMVHEVMATELGVDVGSYFHTANSLHFYEDELEAVKKVRGCAKSVQQMPPMPRSSTPLSDVAIGNAERELRRAVGQSGSLHPYWQGILDVMREGVA